MKFPISNNQFPKVAVVGVSILYTVLFLWLFHRHFSPFGVWSAEIKEPVTKTRLMSGPTPPSRVEADDAQDVWRLNETPVYFEVSPPRRFDQAEFEVEFARNGPIVEAGVVKSQDPWRVEKRVLYHQYLEELEWPRIKEDDLILWQRAPQYESVQEFLESPPEVEEVVTADVGVHAQFPISNFQFPTGLHRYDVSLRGSQDIYLYTAGEDIEVKFLFHDVNRHDGADEVEVVLEKDGEAAAREMLSDDGIVWGTGESKSPRELTVSHRQPQPGVYHLTVSTTDDIFIRRIETAQGKMVWKNTLYLGDEVGYREGARSVTVYSNGQGYALRTPHQGSVQTVEFASLEIQFLSRQRLDLSLVEHNKQYTIQMPREAAGDVLAVTVPKRDVILTTDGFFALSPDAFFLPEPISYASDLDFDRLGVNYVLARYKPTLGGGGGGWRTGYVRVAIHDIDQNEPLQFFIGTPHGAPQSMEIGGAKVKLTKPRLTFSRIRAKIKDILNL